MFDYNYTFVALARSEYEERVRKVEMELLARQRAVRQPSALSQALYSLGEWLEAAGAHLKAQHQTVAIRQSYGNGRAG